MSSQYPAQTREHESVPSWRRDFGRIIGVTVIAVVIMTILVGLSSAGLLYGKRWEKVEADGVWAGIAATLPTLIFPFMFMELSRPDHGFRRKGLIPLLLLGIPAASVLETLTVMTWPFILGDGPYPGSVAAEMTTDPMSIVLVFVFLIAATAWFTTVVMPMAICGYKVALMLLLPFLGAIFLFMIAGVRIFDGSPSVASIIIWSAVALGGLAVLSLVAALRRVFDRSGQVMTEAERVEYARQYRQERDRYGRGEVPHDRR